MELPTGLPPPNPLFHREAARVRTIIMIFQSVLNWGDTACFCLVRMFYGNVELPPNEIQG
jgi:hypothetical protein